MDFVYIFCAPGPDSDDVKTYHLHHFSRLFRGTAPVLYLYGLPYLPCLYICPLHSQSHVHVYEYNNIICQYCTEFCPRVNLVRGCDHRTYEEVCKSLLINGALIAAYLPLRNVDTPLLSAFSNRPKASNDLLIFDCLLLLSCGSTGLV